MMLESLLCLDDADFVDAAFRTLLKRPPDPEGLRSHILLLRSGLDKVVILSAIASSEEGRRLGVKIRGLDAAYRLHRLSQVPLVGHLAVRFVRLFRREPVHNPARAHASVILGKLHPIEPMLFRVQTTVNDLLQRQAQLDSAMTRLESRLDELTAVLAALRGTTGIPPSVVEASGKAAEEPSSLDLSGLRIAPKTQVPSLRKELLEEASNWKT